MKVIISNIIDASNAISHSDGLEVYKYLNSLKSKKEDITISFDGINRVSTAFLNACLGKMLLEGSYSESYINRKQTDKMILRKLDSVIDNAKNHLEYDKIVEDAATC